MFTITLGAIKKNKNSTARTVTNAIGSPIVELKENTSIIRPTFVLDMGYNGCPPAEAIINANYINCSKFNRSYWITNITFLSMDLVEIECEVDALASFAPSIMNSEAYINYASLGYDSMIPDGRIPITARNDYGKIPFVEGTLSAIDTAFGTYVLFFASDGAIGQSGMVQAFALSPAELSTIANKIYVTAEWEKVKDYLYNPDEALHSCLWLPIKKGEIAGVATSMSFGSYSFGSYNVANPRISSSCELTVSLPYIDNKGRYDWRNAEPTTSWFLWLPGVGMIDFPMSTCLKEGTTKPVISVGMQLAVYSGEISYNITCNGILVLFVKGNLGSPVPVGRSSSNFGSVLSSALSGGSNAIMAIASKNPALVAGGGLSAFTSAINAGVNMMQFSASATGAISGWATPLSLMNKVRLFCIPRGLSDDPYGKLKDVIGAPVFKYGKLSEYTGGKVFCSNINYDWSTGSPPTSEEYEMIRSYFTSSEGVFLEDTQ